MKNLACNFQIDKKTLVLFRDLERIDKLREECLKYFDRNISFIKTHEISEIVEITDWMDSEDRLIDCDHENGYAISIMAIEIKLLIEFSRKELDQKTILSHMKGFKLMYEELKRIWK